jgi:hypothetical protein
MQLVELKPKIWWPRAELNHRHTDFQSAALPTELLGLRYYATAHTDFGYGRSALASLNTPSRAVNLRRHVGPCGPTLSAPCSIN